MAVAPPQFVFFFILILGFCFDPTHQKPSVSLNTTRLSKSGDPVLIKWSGVDSPSKLDWLGIYSPPSSRNHHFLGYKFLSSSPTWQSGSGSISLPLINLRSNYSFRIFRWSESEVNPDKHDHDNNPLPGIKHLLATSPELAFESGRVPDQIHLSYTDRLDEMRVMFVTPDRAERAVKYGVRKDGLGDVAAARVSRYELQHMCDWPANHSVGWRDPGFVHDGVMTNLKSGVRYYYKVGSDDGGWSETHSFVSRNGDSDEAVAFMFGDMGTTTPYATFLRVQDESVATMKWILRDIEALGDKPAFVSHIGDISYARGYSWLWDHFFNQIEPVATRLPYHVCIGNHEYDWPSQPWKPEWASSIYGKDGGGECGVPYSVRFNMPGNSSESTGTSAPATRNLYYSFDMGSVHFVYISTETNFVTGSKQHEFIKRDLESVNRTKTPFVVVSGHRPMYTTSNEGRDAEMRRQMMEHLEPLFVNNNVTLASSIEKSGKKFGDYQCNNAMDIWSKIKGKGTAFNNPRSVGEAIMANLPKSDIIESCTVAGPGFVNIVLAKDWMAKSLQKMLVDGIETWAPQLQIKRAVVDFSSPNIAKEMHVGHLRSTIIGDTLARMLEFSKVEVLRRNHVGDWGTQFGMLIQYLFEKFPNVDDVNEMEIGDLQEFYKQSKKRFDEDPAFKERAQAAVVSLQGGTPKYREAWLQICEVSRREFQMVYERLGTQLEEKGESFYNPYIPGVLEKLTEQGLIVESEGARVIHLEGFSIPLIVVKSNGSYNYASTDLAALWYRLNEEKAEWIIYVTDVGQQQHFNMFFKAATLAGWLPADGSYPKVSHVGFGLVLGEDGKRFRTRSSDVVRLVDLLDEAKSRSKTSLVERGKSEDFTEEELEKIAVAVGYGAVKYADLKNNRLTNYTFDFDQMLNDKGNTAVYLLYMHARICSIIRKSGKDIDELKKTGEIVLGHAGEGELALHLLKFSETVEEACTNLLPSVLCEYLYNLSEIFSGKFYSNCQVIGTPEETSRLLLCEATGVVMRKCFHLLGIEAVYKM